MSMSNDIKTLTAIADELAAAKRWTEARAVQNAIIAIQACETPALEDEGADHGIATL